MNSAPPFGPNLAVVRYSDNDFEVMKSGRYVLCAVTGDPIALEDLRYWNVDRQEAYSTAAAAHKAFQTKR